MKFLLAAISLCLLSGCIVMEPSPAVEAAQLLGTAASGAMALTPEKPQGLIRHGDPATSNICIIYNETANVSDLVPSIQAALQHNKIDSRVYLPGTAPSNCVALSYAAYLEWAKPPFSDHYASYLTFATLTLHQDGRVLASAYYQLTDRQLGRWASTERKIEPVVNALFQDENKAAAATGRTETTKRKASW